MVTGGLADVIVSAFRAASLVSYLGHNDLHDLIFEGLAATKTRHWNSALQVEDGMGPAGKNREKP
jgi:hypothetical protein